MKIQEGKTYLTVPHESGELVFQHPPFRGTYGNVAEQVGKEGLKRPNSSETASLIYDALQNPKGEYESQILDILKDNWFWEFTGNLYLPKSNEEVSNGVIIEDNPTIVNGRLNMDKKTLIKRLQADDKSVRFVPFGYKIEAQTPEELGKNPYIVARYGEEGAEKIAKIASQFKHNPHIWRFNSVDEETARMSALDRSGDFGSRLNVFGIGWDGDGGGLSFGVCAPEKIK